MKLNAKLPATSFRLFPGSAIPETVRSRWLDLWWRQPLDQRTPFLHPDVTVAAASVVPGTEVAVAEQDGDLVAFLPFQRVGRIGLPVADDLSNGDGMVVASGTELSMVDLVRACRLREMRWVHRDVHPSPMSPFDHFVSPAAMVDLSDGFDAYADRLSAESSMLKQTSRKRRKLERERGPVSFSVLGDHALAETLLSWKAQQLREREDEPDWDPAIAVPLMAALDEIPSGDIRSVLSVLTAGEEIVALNWGLAAGGRFVSCIPAYNADLASYSPGAILHVELLTHMGDIDVELFDLGLGMDQLKQRLLTHTQPMASGAVHASALDRVARRGRTLARKALRGS